MPKAWTVKDIVTDWLVSHGFGGLRNGNCACEIGNLTRQSNNFCADCVVVRGEDMKAEERVALQWERKLSEPRTPPWKDEALTIEDLRLLVEQYHGRLVACGDLIQALRDAIQSVVKEAQ